MQQHGVIDQLKIQQKQDTFSVLKIDVNAKSIP